MGKLSKTLAISAFLLLLATAAVLWAVSTNTSLAGDDSKSFSYSFHSSSRGAFLGVAVAEETEHPEGGARIESVVEDSAADEAGLEEGDIIVGVDGDTIRGPQGLTKRLSEREPGDAAEITVIRNGRERSYDVELGRRTGWLVHSPLAGTFDFAVPTLEMFDCENEDDCSFSWNCEGDDCEEWSLNLGTLLQRRPILGVQLVHVTNELREHMGGSEELGVLVSRIVSGSPAEEAGIEVGDLIVAVDGEPIEDAGDIREALAGKAGESFDVEVIRDRRRTSIGVTIPLREEEKAGPRAYHLPDLRMLIDDEVKEALGAARESYREALRVARVQRPATTREARRAYREALQLSRDVRRKTARQARDAVRQYRDRLNAI